MNFQIITLLFVFHFVCSKDFYDLLGIKKDASIREIRKAFKKLALIHHPDKSNDEDSHEKFLQLNRAYEVLKDEELRKKYDLYGEDGIDDNKKGKQKVLNLIKII